MNKWSRSSLLTLPLWLFLLGSILFFVACAGEPGLMGPPGSKGDTGAQGIQGVKGDTGAQGLIGLKGDTGAQGPQGIPGAAGAAGAKGDQGPAGASAFLLAEGYKLTITGVTIAADRKPVVTFTAADGKGQPLQLIDLDSNPSFIIAYIKKDPTTEITQYVNYITSSVTGTSFVLDGKTVQPKLATWPNRPGVDSGGVFAQVSPGKYTYTFKNVLPATYDTKATHSVGVYTSRSGRAFISNDVYDFVPAGGPVTVTRQLVNIDNCNACHDQLSAHGGLRQQTRLCVLCHTSQNVDPESGNTVEMQVMVHRIHSGARLQSVLSGTPYYIVGYNKNVFNFGEVRWPQDTRNCTTCHKNAPNADEYKTKPTAAACTSCHDDVDPIKGIKHDVQTDADCTTCHKADTGREFDNSVVGAHVIPVKSKQLVGVSFALLAATAKVGEKPTVDFQIKDNAGNSLDPNKFDYLEVTIAGPTTDYAQRINEAVNRITVPPAAPFVKTGVLTDLTGGKWRYTFSVALTDTAVWKGSVGIGMGGYKNATITGRQGASVSLREGAINPVIYVSLDGSPVAPRRSVVDRNNCNQCHLDLGSPAGISIHGGSRRNTEYCIMCHNANFADNPAPSVRPAAESLHFKYMVHSLHMGDDRPVATAFGSRNQAQTTEILFPGIINNCTNCHKTGTNLLPLPKNLLPTKVTQNNVVIKTIQPIAAACTACHASPETQAHAEINTSAKNIESCVTCHAENREFAVSKMHQ